MKRVFILILSILSLGLAVAQPRSAVQRNGKPQVGIALSGGGALGFAHIGALQALEENGIHPDCVAGTSMGAIIGVLYSAGYKPKEMLDIVLNKKLYQVKRLITLQSAISSLGMSSHEVLYNALRQLIPHNSFDSLKIPFTVCVTNLDLVRPEYYSAGTNLVNYVVASASIPGAFEAKKIDGTTYVDGGVLDNLPARQLHNNGCRYIIGVDVLPIVENMKKKNSIDIAIISLRAMQHTNSIPGIEVCDWLINSYALIEYHEFSFEQYREIYQYGYRATIDYINSHPDMVRKTAVK